MEVKLYCFSLLCFLSQISWHICDIFEIKGVFMTRRAFSSFPIANTISLVNIVRCQENEFVTVCFLFEPSFTMFSFHFADIFSLPCLLTILCFTYLPTTEAQDQGKQETNQFSCKNLLFLQHKNLKDSYTDCWSNGTTTWHPHPHHYTL